MQQLLEGHQQNLKQETSYLFGTYFMDLCFPVEMMLVSVWQSISVSTSLRWLPDIRIIKTKMAQELIQVEEIMLVMVHKIIKTPEGKEETPLAQESTKEEFPVTNQ
jgi:hypothetical protein